MVLIPLGDITKDTVSSTFARVAVRVIAREWARTSPKPADRYAWICDLGLSYERMGLRMLGWWLIACAARCRSKGLTLDQWRYEVVYRSRVHRSRAGTPRAWRRVPPCY